MDGDGKRAIGKEIDGERQRTRGKEIDYAF